MVIALNIIYLIIILFFVLAAAFISYHLHRFSLSKVESTISLAIFLSVFVTLIFSNLILFTTVDFGQLFELM